MNIIEDKQCYMIASVERYSQELHEIAILLRGCRWEDDFDIAIRKLDMIKNGIKYLTSDDFGMLNAFQDITEDTTD